MKCKVSIYKALRIIVLVISLYSCTNKTGIPRHTNDFIQHFLDQNSERIYKSEIQRVKVNFFPSSHMLVYSFWKEGKFNMNGDLFLHLYPTDSVNLSKNRLKHGFVNLPLDKSAIVNAPAPFFYILQNLQLPFELSSIQTGQFNKHGKTWKADFDIEKFLKKLPPQKLSVLSKKRGIYTNTESQSKDIVNQYPTFGPEVYRSRNNKVQVFLNVNTNIVTIIFEDYEVGKSSKKELFIYINDNQNGKERRIILPLDELEIYKNKAILTYNLGYGEHFDSIKLGQIVNGREITWKDLERKKLIYTTYPFKLDKDTDPLQDEEVSIDLIYNLISRNLPLIYQNSVKKIELYLNSSNKKAYLVSHDANSFDELELYYTVGKEKNSKVEDLNLQNSFFIKGNNRHIVVHELLLPNDSNEIQMLIHSGRQLLFEQTIGHYGVNQNTRTGAKNRFN